jgi:hypothetical protein
MQQVLRTFITNNTFPQTLAVPQVFKRSAEEFCWDFLTDAETKLVATIITSL